jgi:CheY-like chemotaxis protein
VALELQLLARMGTLALPGPNDTARPAAHLLVIDDDSTFATLLKEELERTGFAVATGPTAPRAIETVQSGHCNVMIVDRHMPGIDGLDFLSCVRYRHPSTPVIFLAAFGGQLVEEAARRRGACAFGGIVSARTSRMPPDSRPTTSRGAERHGLIIDEDAAFGNACVDAVGEAPGGEGFGARPAYLEKPARVADLVAGAAFTGDHSGHARATRRQAFTSHHALAVPPACAPSTGCGHR